MLLDTLNKFAKKMNKEYPYMNHGGCGVFAIHMAKRLSRVLPTKIVVFNWERLDLDRIKEEIRDKTDGDLWYEHCICFVHIVVEFEYEGEVYHYDTDGVRLKDRNWGDIAVLCDGSLTVDELEPLIADSSNWNCRFDRQNIPNIKRRVKNVFSRFVYAGREYQYC